MKTLTRAVASLALGLLAAAWAVAADAGDYLTQDGKLKETLDLTDVQGGFAGFTGKGYVVEPSGEWKLLKVFNDKKDVEAKGTLSKEQLAALAKELAAYDLAGLADTKAGKAGANPHVVTVHWGKKETVVTLNASDPLPRPDKTSVGGRVAGVAAAVADLAKAPPK